jgi:hypothetical protein
MRNSRLILYLALPAGEFLHREFNRQFQGFPICREASERHIGPFVLQRAEVYLFLKSGVVESFHPCNNFVVYFMFSAMLILLYSSSQNHFSHVVHARSAA